MWSLQSIRKVFVVSGLVGILLFAWPSLALILHLPYGETFSELYVLGSTPGRMAYDYPFNVTEGETYNVTVGVGNHLGKSVCYELDVKLKNETDPFPNSTDATPSPLPPLYQYREFLAENWTQENLLIFSFSNITSAGNVTTVGEFTINNTTANSSKTFNWNPVLNGSYCQLLIEMWLYNASSNNFAYHNRYVYLWLNMTAPSHS